MNILKYLLFINAYLFIVSCKIKAIHNAKKNIK